MELLKEQLQERERKLHEKMSTCASYKVSFSKRRSRSISPLSIIPE
ncbi:hypothetical protein C4K18_4224 [Pseudomonas chlororaphis subsp. aurantiaca]|nr:hypothetical protein C4K18_4224 [Pseudomonas chlororaphis subsp. aurantiaca]